ncbi:MAG: alpha/beta fold hydrolase [Deltaproteobacteria bacterium]|nr:alpha/beta fold hydrolase [Deltaproteobacteria bacterium]
MISKDLVTPWFLAAALLVLGTGAGCQDGGGPKPGTTAASASASGTAAASATIELGPNSTLVDRAKAYVIWLDAESYDKAFALHDEAMKKAVTEKKQRNAWNAVVGKYGAFQKVLHTSQSEMKGYQIVVVTCQFEGEPLGLRVVFNKEQQVSGMQFVPPEPASGASAAASAGPAPKRPQTPKPPFPYDQREVQYDNPTDGSRIVGTLTIPKGEGPHPAALLITGSGGQDRDETIFHHKPFFVIADHLTRKGIAVLRVDDRGVGKSTGKAAEATVETHATDVAVGVEFLRKQKEIDPKRIGLIGHSEGGIIAPLVASEDPAIAFIVSLAGTGVTGEQLVPIQVGLIARRQQKFPEEVVGKMVAAQQKIMKLVASGADELAVRPVVKEGIELSVKHAPGQPKMSAKQLEAAVADGAAKVCSPWFRSFTRLNPAVPWGKVKCPVLILMGDKDTQVPPDANLPPLQQALAGNRSARFEKREGLNHLFQHAETGFSDEYATIEETFDPATLELMASWLGDQVLKTK